MPYRLDKSAFKAQTFEEADDNKNYWLEKTSEERLKAAWYLISCAFNFPLSNPPRIDRKAFSCRKHSQK